MLVVVGITVAAARGCPLCHDIVPLSLSFFLFASPRRHPGLLAHPTVAGVEPAAASLAIASISIARRLQRDGTMEAGKASYGLAPSVHQSSSKDGTRLHSEQRRPQAYSAPYSNTPTGAASNSTTHISIATKTTLQ